MFPVSHSICDVHNNDTDKYVHVHELTRNTCCSWKSGRVIDLGNTECFIVKGCSYHMEQNLPCLKMKLNANYVRLYIVCISKCHVQIRNPNHMQITLNFLS